MQAGFRVGQQQAAVPQSNVWSSRITQCGPPSTGSEWAFSFLCCPCAAATAKSRVDKSNPVYDFFCWNPIASYAFVRHEYGIEGVCGDDCGYGLFCGPCTIRQMYTETRLRHASSRDAARLYAQNLDQWQKSLFDCTFCGFLKAFLCPCCAAADVRDVLQPTSTQDDCFNVFCLNPAAMYGQVRNHYGIVADCPLLEDMFLALLCFPCALNRARVEAQYRREMAFKAAQPQGNQNPGFLGGVFRRN